MASQILDQFAVPALHLFNGKFHFNEIRSKLTIPMKNITATTANGMSGAAIAGTVPRSVNYISV